MCQQKQAHYYNGRARDLAPLQEGYAVHETIHIEWEDMGKATVAKRLDKQLYLVGTEDASYRQNRVDLWKTQEMSQPDTSSIKRRKVNSGNGCQKPQPLCQPASMSPSKQPEILFHTSDNCTTK